MSGGRQRKKKEAADRRPRRWLVPTLITVLTLVVLGGLGVGIWFGVDAYQESKERGGRSDAPVAGRRGEDSPVKVYNMPDGFGNLATKCIGPDKRAYTTTHFDQNSDGEDSEPTNANFVVVPDPKCH
jgi:hypothetical protein